MIRRAARGMKFRPREVLFSPTSQCNLACGHCTVARSDGRLSIKRAMAFLASCKKSGVKRVGFTGGEPFLYPAFLIALTKETIRHKLLFGRIMTNAVWWSDERAMRRILAHLQSSGFDGTICVSVDAFHRQAIDKLRRFIETAVEIWNRPDIIEIATVVGARDKETALKIGRLARVLKGRICGKLSGSALIKSGGLFVKITPVRFSAPPSNSASKLAWDGRWFKEDYCAGPGNVFFIESCGTIKPCCGYANDLGELTLGNIYNDSSAVAITNARNNRFVRTVFSSGLSGIRKRIAKHGVSFPGKTTDHCYFCRYLLTQIPSDVVNKSLD